MLTDRYLRRAVSHAKVVVRSLARDEKDEVGVLLDRTARPYVGQLRLSAARALLDFAVQLGHRNDWNVESLGEVLEATADLSHFLGTVFIASRSGNELKIIDDEQIDSLLHRKRLRFRAHL